MSGGTLVPATAPQRDAIQTQERTNVVRMRLLSGFCGGFLVGWLVGLLLLFPLKFCVSPHWALKLKKRNQA